MAKLIYAVITSLDGYIADETENFDWAVPSEEGSGGYVIVAVPAARIYLLHDASSRYSSGAAKIKTLICLFSETLWRPAFPREGDQFPPTITVTMEPLPLAKKPCNR